MSFQKKTQKKTKQTHNTTFDHIQQFIFFLLGGYNGNNSTKKYAVQHDVTPKYVLPSTSSSVRMNTNLTLRKL